MTEHFQTGLKKGRGMAAASLGMIDAMYGMAREAQPITVRGIAYKLFAAKLITSMAKIETQKVSRLLTQARERDMIPWEWIVDETRRLEVGASWSDPEEYIECSRNDYRRDLWQDQPHRVEVWSEKGTIRGVLAPTLHKLGVGFRVMHGFGSATAVHDIAEDYDGRNLIALYVGDIDPSGMWMSEHDLPARLERYDGDHVTVKRIALRLADTPGLSWFPASDKSKDRRYGWFVANHGSRCWELDAMDPNALRNRVEHEIRKLIEPEAWSRGMLCARAEEESLRKFFDSCGE